MTAKDWRHIYRKYPGKWVALDAQDELTVISASDDARTAYAESARQGKRAILHRVPEKIVDFIGYEV
jgi:hypothetical protein